MKRRRPFAAAAASLLLLAGCTLGPDVRPPQMPLPDAWSAPLPDAFADVSAGTAWWQGFGDAQLDRLIERALIANRDLERAVAVIAEARALRTQAAASFYPQVDGSASVTRRRQRRSLLDRHVLRSRLRCRLGARRVRQDTARGGGGRGRH